MNPSYVICSLVLSFAVGSAGADTSTSLQPISPVIVHLEAGIICPPETIETVPAPDTLAGKTHVIDIEPPFVSNAQLVPAALGIGFGIKSQTVIEGGLEGVTMVVTHPAMGPNATASQSFTTSISDRDPSLTFYQFDYPYELVLGSWQMTAMHDEEILYQVQFDVVEAKMLPNLARACGYLDLLS